MVDPIERAVFGDIHGRVNPCAVESDKRHVEGAEEIGVVARAVTIGRLPKDSYVYRKPRTPEVLPITFGFEPVSAESGVRCVAADVDRCDAKDANENASPSLATRNWRFCWLGFIHGMRERRLTTSSSATAEGWHDCCAAGSAGSSRHDRP